MLSQIVKDDIAELLEQKIDYEYFRNKTILVTGANGQIASYLVLFFLSLSKVLDDSIKVIALVRNLDKAKGRFSEFLDSPSLEIIHQDVCLPIEIQDSADIVIHAASLASAFAMTNDPISIIKANTLGTLNTLEYCRRANSKKVMFLSTREVYGDVAVDSIDENEIGKMNQLDIRSCYPESKRVAENLLVCYQYQYNVSYVITRIAHTYGPLMEIKNDGRVMADMINFIVNDNGIKLNSDGSAVRAFCYITDTVAALLRILISAENQVYNVANEQEPISIRELAELLIELYPNRGLTLDVLCSNEAYRHGYLKTVRKELNTDKVRSLGWEPKISLREGLKRTCSYFGIEE